MRKGIKFSFGAALAGVAFATCPVQAAELGDTVTTIQPAVALIMPFDVTDGKASFQLVSRIGGEDSDPLATHWSFWSESCDHLADVFICLTPRDTVVVDPTALQGQIQTGQSNINTGPVINLTGEKGFVTVTSFDADTNSQTCEPEDPEAPSGTPALIGSWVVANTATNAAFGNNAIGVVDGQTLPAGGDFFLTGPVAAGLFLQTFNPLDLQDSEVFFIGVAFPAGNAQFSESEIGPIPSALTNGSAVCCNAQYYDNVESFVSLPDICVTCSSTAKIAENDSLAAIDLPAIIPASIPAETSGFVRITNCQVGSDEGNVPIGDTTINGIDLTTFLFAYHGQAVGPYGTSVLGRYTAE
ncbi:MAG: hypothetical protein IT293_22175 [Deltaproteobacteria bacterium]|nr:hypothetical protein [Deltaproteobacteria bacterium]